jgi:hypothetical protein
MHLHETELSSHDSHRWLDLTVSIQTGQRSKCQSKKKRKIKRILVSKLFL